MMLKPLRFFKTLSIVFFLILIIIAISLIIFINFFDVNKYKPYIESQFSNLIKKHVYTDKLILNFSLQRGLSLEIKGMFVKDNAKFSSESIISVENIFLNLDLNNFLFKRQITVSKIEILRPKINIIRGSNGIINFPKVSKEENNEISSNMETNTKEKEKIGPTNFLKFTINKISLINGTITYLDNSLDDKLYIPIKNINLKTDEVSLNKSSVFNLNCSLWSSEQNIELVGNFLTDSNELTIVFNELNFNTNLSKLSINEISHDIPMFEKLKVNQRIDGEILLNVKKMAFNREGLKNLLGMGRLTDGKVSSGYMGIPFENIDLRFSFDESKVTLNELFMYFASGKVSAKADIANFFIKPEYSFSLNFEDIHINDLMQKQDLSYKMEGKLQGAFLGSGIITKNESFERNLTSEGSIEVKNGKIFNINILKVVINNLGIIPDLAEEIDKNLPEEYSEKLNQKDTIINEAKSSLNIQDNNIFIPNLKIDADGFVANINAQIDFENNIKLNSAQILIPKELAKLMGNSIEELTYLMNDSGQIFIPLSPFNGKLKEFRTYPDLKELSKKILKGKGKDELRNAIFKVFDIDETPQENNLNDSKNNNISPEKQLIDNILNSIFK